MRTVSSAWSALETAGERSPAYLIHIYALRNGRVTLPSGWGSWTYSVGFQGNVTFTDLYNYAGDWATPSSSSAITRTYAPAAIEFDASQVFRQESTSLDPHSINLTFDPSLEPFADYVNRQWPLTFGIVIYKVHRNGNAVATADDGSGHNQIPVVDVIFIGYLDADDVYDANSAGLEITIEGQPAKYKLTTKWDHITKAFDRLVPRPVYSIDCPKILFSTGPAMTSCNADPTYVQCSDVIVATNGVVVSSAAWGAFSLGWFAQGWLQYTATDPVSNLPFTFNLLIIAHTLRTVGSITYGDLALEMFPPLVGGVVGALATAFAGCNRQRNTCVSKHIPAGSAPPPPGAFNEGTLEIALGITNTTTNAHPAVITITSTGLNITYFGTDTNQIGSIDINSTSWDPTWANLTASTIITQPGYNLTGNQSFANSPGFKITLTNNGGASGASILQQPNAGNGYTAKIKVPGIGAYDFIIAWIANAGQPVFSGNLQNFGGTDIPITHPSLEATQ